MNSYSIFLSGLLAIHCLAGAEDISKHGRYYAELEALKESQDIKLMFNEDAHQGLATIERDILIRQNLTLLQRFVRLNFLSCDVVLVTPETMPLLYEYIDSVCKKARIETPVVFITRQDGFLNAFAEKLLMSTGAILIYQKSMKELSDEGLEGLVAHELGHIKYNHSNKKWALLLCAELFNHQVLHRLGIRIPFATTLMVAFIINKRFEKEADAFAYEVNGKGKGLIEFFELLLKKGEIREDEFFIVYELLKNNKSSLSSFDYYRLAARYYWAKGGHLCTKVWDTIYHETFIGAHPSPQARIKAAQDYLAQQNA